MLIVQRIRQLLDQQIRTTMSALAAPSGHTDWRSYHEREIEIHSLFDELETAGLSLSRETSSRHPPENPKCERS